MATEATPLKTDTKPEIKKLLTPQWKLPKDMKELCKNALFVLWEMEKGFSEQIINRDDYLKSNSTFDHVLNTKNPVNIYEKAGKRILESIQPIWKFSALAQAATDLLWIETFPEHHVTSMVDCLYKINKQVKDNFNKDRWDDDILNQPENITYTWTSLNFIDKWNDLFYAKQENEKKYKEDIDKISSTELLAWVLNIPEWISAFELWYQEILERVWPGWNIFTFIDKTFLNQKKTKEINQQERNATILSCISCLLSRGKIDDFKKFFDWYSKKADIQKIMEENSTHHEPLKKAILQSYASIENIKWLNITSVFEKSKDPLFKKANKEYKNHLDSISQKIDIFKSKKINGLFLYGNEEHEWGAGAFFYQDKKKFLAQWFTLIEENKTKDCYSIKLKKWSDTITMLLLEQKNYRDKYEKIIVENKMIKSWWDYNLISLRWHCYTTQYFAKILWKNNLAKESSVLIDWGCWNANRISGYKKDWVESAIFAYTSTWKWNATAFVIDKIFELKNTLGSFTGFIDTLNTYKNKSENTVAWYAANTMIKPDSAFYFYSIEKEEEKN